METLLTGIKMNFNDVLTLPDAKSFSDLDFGSENYELPSTEIDWSEVFLEDTILAMMKTLDSDQERIILLLMAMGKDGYQFQHKDVALLMQIDYSWYMRKVRAVKKKLLPYLGKRTKKSVKVEEKSEESGEIL